MQRADQWLYGIAILAFVYAVAGNYIALPGYLNYLARGGTSAAGNSMDLAVLIGAIKTILWMLAFNIGAFCLYYAGLRHCPRGLRHLGLGIGLLWIVFWVQPQLPRVHVLFYLGFGSCILVMIMLAGYASRGSDLDEVPGNDPRRRFLLLTALYFFAVATWDVCGLGSTGRILHPDQVVLPRSQILLSTQTTKMMLAFVFAWTAVAFALLPDRQRPLLP